MRLDTSWTSRQAAPGAPARTTFGQLPAPTAMPAAKEATPDRATNQRYLRVRLRIIPGEVPARASPESS
jgi:hypothetical protein